MCRHRRPVVGEPRAPHQVDEERGEARRARRPTTPSIDDDAHVRRPAPAASRSAPKQTGQASAARGAATSSASVQQSRSHRATGSSSSAGTPRRTRPAPPPPASDRDAVSDVDDLVLERGTAPPAHAATERREHDRQRDEQQVKRPQRHVSAPRARRAGAGALNRRADACPSTVSIGTNISTMKNDDRQDQRAVDPLLLVAQVHEDARHHRALRSSR